MGINALAHRAIRYRTMLSLTRVRIEKLPNSTEFPFAKIDETKHGKDRRVIQVVHTRVSKKSKLFTYRL